MCTALNTLSCMPPPPPSLALSLSISSLKTPHVTILYMFMHTCNLYSGCYLGVYSGLGAAQALLILFGAFSLALAAIFASRTLHSMITKNILRSPMTFFDTTPLGRVLNRFSKDIYIIDEVIPQSVRSFLFTFFSVLNTLIVIIIATPTFVVAIVPLGIFYFLVQVRTS